MKKASDLFSVDDHLRIAAAITQAEAATSAEIVPVVATRSGRYDRAEDVVGLIAAVCLFLTGWLVAQEVTPAGGDWASGYVIVFGPVASVVTFILGFALGSSLATLFPSLALPFIPVREMKEEVERSAAEVFQTCRIRATKEATGVLIYVSLHEHLVRVLGDDAITAKISPEEWAGVARLVTDGMKNRRPTDGLIAAIEKCGQLLAGPLPRSEDDENELPNELIILD